MSMGVVLDVAIGLSFIYFLLALLCSGCNEMLASWLNKRGKYLFDGLREMLRDDEKMKAFVTHPLIESLDRIREGFDTTRAQVNADSLGKTRIHVFPSYISPETVATVLLDIVSPEGGANRFAGVRGQIEKLPGAELKKAMLTICDRADNDIEKLRKGVEDWYSNTMDRVSGWYKAHAQNCLIVMALVAAAVLNVDTLRIVSELWNNPTGRSELVRLANSAVHASGEQDIKKQLEAIKNAKPEDRLALQKKLNDQVGSIVAVAEQTRIPFGWTESQLDEKWTFMAFVSKLFGLVITAAAVALGAPFWFELMNKLVDIRAAGRKPEEK